MLLYLMFMIPGLLLSLAASAMTRSAFSKYSKVRAASGMTGAQAAQVMLDRAGIRDVRVVPTRGYLSDHYNPATKTLALSEAVYSQPSVAAIGVACHEAGHAIQHAHGYAPLWVRSMLVPLAGFGSNVGYLIILAGLFLNQAGWILFGSLLFSAVLLFQIVTLPVEFNASSRAKELAFQHGLVSVQERSGMSRVLNAAAMTYVAAMVATFLTLMQFLLQAFLMSRD